MDLFTILGVVYVIWGVWCGWKFIKGRWEALEKPTIAMKIVKIMIAICIGPIIGIFKLLEHVFKLMGMFSNL